MRALIAYFLSISMALATDVRAIVPASQPLTVQGSSQVNFNLDVWGCDLVSIGMNGDTPAQILYPFTVNFTAVFSGTNTLTVVYCDIIGRTGTNVTQFVSTSINPVVRIRQIRR